jgi:hypothetical protein
MKCNMPNAEEWGVPDWRSVANYDPQARSGREWAWEFLRRNPDYRSFWRNKIEPYLDADGWIAYNKSGESCPYLQELQDTFGVDNPSAPDSSTPCRFVSNWLRSVSPKSRSKLGLGPFGGNLVPIELRETEVAFVIDLARPIRHQIKAIERAALRRSRGIKSPRTSERFGTYLRLLDADDSGADRKTSEAVMFSDIENDHPDRRRSKTFDNCRRRALHLRDVGYRGLVHLAP